ncbi:SCO-spondin [Atta colombica]|uniref:SCO-spondin n=1 Tax=Atta colombica TaxID=520822 RepID=A0A195AUX7_9HYME|nr:SCO-spondin [Atta colombica]
MCLCVCVRSDSDPRWTPERRRECDPRTEMRCDDGSCVLLRRKCDNIFDCLDGSDERGCGVCIPAEWKCASGECLPENQRCDGITQCSDGSDEDLCECPDGQLPCDNGVCINKNFFCDHNIDCHDASDERNCRKDIFG